MDPAKITIIVNLPPPKSIKQLHLVTPGYYRKFIQGYAKITAPMERQLKKDIKFEWTPECQSKPRHSERKMVTAPILVFPDWNKEFHVHVDASSML